MINRSIDWNSKNRGGEGAGVKVGKSKAERKIDREIEREKRGMLAQSSAYVRARGRTIKP